MATERTGQHSAEWPADRWMRSVQLSPATVSAAFHSLLNRYFLYVVHCAFSVNVRLAYSAPTISKGKITLKSHLITYSSHLRTIFALNTLLTDSSNLSTTKLWH